MTTDDGYCCWWWWLWASLLYESRLWREGDDEGEGVWPLHSARPLVYEAMRSTTARDWRMRIRSLLRKVYFVFYFNIYTCSWGMILTYFECLGLLRRSVAYEETLTHEMKHIYISEMLH